MENTNTDVDQMSVVSGTTDGSVTESISGQDCLRVLPSLCEAERVSPVIPCQDFISSPQLFQCGLPQKLVPQSLGFGNGNILQAEWTDDLKHLLPEVTHSQQTTDADCCKRDVLKSGEVNYLHSVSSQASTVDLFAHQVYSHINPTQVHFDGHNRYEEYCAITQSTSQYTDSFVVADSSEGYSELECMYDSQNDLVARWKKGHCLGMSESMGSGNVSGIHARGVSLVLSDSVSRDDSMKIVCNTACLCEGLSSLMYINKAGVLDDSLVAGGQTVLDESLVAGGQRDLFESQALSEGGGHTQMSLGSQPRFDQQKVSASGIFSCSDQSKLTDMKVSGQGNSSSCLQIQEISEQGNSSSCLQMQEICEQGNSSSCLQIQEISEQGNISSCLQIQKISEQGNSSSCLQIKEISGQGNSSSCLQIQEISEQGNSSSCLQIQEISEQENSSSCLQIQKISEEGNSSSCLQIQEISGQGNSSSCLQIQEISGQGNSSSCLQIQEISGQGNSSSCLQIQEICEQGNSSSCLQIQEICEQGNSSSCLQIQEICEQGNSSSCLQIQEISGQGNSSSHLQCKDIYQKETYTKDVQKTSCENNPSPDTLNWTSYSSHVSAPAQPSHFLTSVNGELKEAVASHVVAESDNCSVASHSTVSPLESLQRAFQGKDSVLPGSPLMPQKAQEINKNRTDIARVETGGSVTSSQESVASSLLLNCPSLEESREATRKVRSRLCSTGVTADVKSSSRKKRAYSQPASDQQHLQLSGMLTAVTGGLGEDAQADSAVPGDRTKHVDNHSLTAADMDIPADSKTQDCENRLSDSMKMTSSRTAKVYNKELHRLVDLYDKMLDKLNSGRVVDGKLQLEKFEQIIHKLNTSQESSRARLLASAHRHGPAWQRQWQHMLESQEMLALAWDKHQLLKQRVWAGKGGGQVDKPERIGQHRLHYSTSCGQQNSCSSLCNFRSSAKQCGKIVCGRGQQSGVSDSQARTVSGQVDVQKEQLSTRSGADSARRGINDCQVVRKSGQVDVQKGHLSSEGGDPHWRHRSSRHAGIQGTWRDVPHVGDGSSRHTGIQETGSVGLHLGDHSRRHAGIQGTGSVGLHLGDHSRRHAGIQGTGSVGLHLGDHSRRHAEIHGTGGVGLHLGDSGSRQGTGGSNSQQQIISEKPLLETRSRIPSPQARLVSTVQLAKKGEITSPALAINTAASFIMADQTCLENLTQQPQAEHLSMELADMGVSDAEKVHVSMDDIHRVTSQSHDSKNPNPLGIESHDETSGNMDGSDAGDVRRQSATCRLPATGLSCSPCLPDHHLAQAVAGASLAQDAHVTIDHADTAISKHIDTSAARTLTDTAISQHIDTTSTTRTLTDTAIFQYIDTTSTTRTLTDTAISQHIDTTSATRTLTDRVTGKRFIVVDQRDATTVQDVGARVTGNRFIVVDQRDATMVQDDGATCEAQTTSATTNRVAENRFTVVEYRDTALSVQGVGPGGDFQAYTKPPQTSTSAQTQGLNVACHVVSHLPGTRASPTIKPNVCTSESGLVWNTTKLNTRNKPASPSSSVGSSLFVVSSKEITRRIDRKASENNSCTNQSESVQTHNRNLHCQVSETAKPRTFSVFSLQSVGAKHLTTKTSPVKYATVDPKSGRGQAAFRDTQLASNLPASPCQPHITPCSLNLAVNGHTDMVTSDCRKRGRPRKKTTAGNQGKKAKSCHLTNTLHQGQIQHYFPLLKQFVTSESGSVNNCHTTDGYVNNCHTTDGSENNCQSSGGSVNNCQSTSGSVNNCQSTSGSVNNFQSTSGSVNSFQSISQPHISVDCVTGLDCTKVVSVSKEYSKNTEANKMAQFSSSEESSRKSSKDIDTSVLIRNLRTILLIADEEVTGTSHDFPSDFWDEDFSSIRMSKSFWESLDVW